jgi:glycosyltransferase involved in cell wall biosynthesis
MNLIQVMASNKLGGAERFFCRLAHSLAEQDIQQTVMLRKNNPYVNAFQNQIPCVTAPFSGKLDFKSKKQLNDLIKNENPDIVMSWMNRASELTCKLHRTKKYQHVARLGGYYNLKYYKHCDHFIGNTKGITDYLIQSGVPTKRVHYISNFATEQPGTPLARPTDRPLLVALGRLHTNKAFDTLIRAMPDVKGAELWIGGTGALEADLKKLILELNLQDRVKLLGWIDKPEDLIATGDIFICPSRHEPLGNVILEAWAQSKPVLSTQNQGGTELIKHEENGYLTPVDDALALSTAINKMLNNKEFCKNMARAGQETYQQQFSTEIITNNYLELFKTLSPSINQTRAQYPNK